mgnify:CR=1 FL=1
MFVEKVVALIGDVPPQFTPVLYVMAFVAFLWILDGFFFLFRFLAGGGR